MTTDSTGQPVRWWFDFYFRKSLNVQKNLECFLRKSVTADGSLLSPTGGVKGMYLARHVHEHLATAC